jgi:molybdopterin-binding protein
MQRKPGHFGVQGMRDRAANMGATLRFVSSEGKGTEVLLVVPGTVAFGSHGWRSLHSQLLLRGLSRRQTIAWHKLWNRTLARSVDVSSIEATRPGRDMTLSARNQFPGRIDAIQVGDVLAHITVRTGDSAIASVITSQSAEEMGLKVGSSVTAVSRRLKSSSRSLERGARRLRSCFFRPFPGSD